MTKRVAKQSRLEVLSHIAFIVACGLIGYSALVRSTEPRVPARNGFADGRIVDSDLLRQRPGTRTLFIGVQSTCRYCTQSMPFYRQVIDRAKGHSVTVIVGSREPADTTRRYLEAHNVRPHHTIEADLAIPIPATPALLWLDESGRVDRSWLGALTSAQEQEVLALMDAVQ